MKRLRTFGLMLILSMGLAGNIFATGPVAVSAVGLNPGLLTFAVEQFLSLLRSGECPLRVCQDCRPNNEGNGDDGNGNCRPQVN